MCISDEPEDPLNFKTRYKEHLDSKKPSHLLDNNHHTNINNIEILNFASKGKKSTY